VGLPNGSEPDVEQDVALPGFGLPDAQTVGRVMPVCHGANGVLEVPRHP
jgi:hypothetical protein